ncbi:MAG: type VII secretion protein EssC [Firmicutes bacterium]|nr:type VII secretion protein EssC [Bacillota bacterium]
MKVKLIGKTQIVSLTLPQRVYGNYWITSENKENLINIEAIDNKWIVKSNSDIKITQDNHYIEACELIENHFYHFFDVTTGEKYRVFVGETFDSHKLLLQFVDSGNMTFTIGNSSSSEGGNPNYISYENPNIHYNQLEITRNNNIYRLRNLYPDVSVYVNNYLTTECYIRNGDVIFLEGLTFSVIGNILMLGTIDTKVKYVTNKFVPYQKPQLDYSLVDKIVDQNLEMYNKNDYFIRPPRFSEIIELKEFAVDGPPNKQTTESIPMFLTLGPMVVMGMSASITGVTALIRVLNGEATFKDSFSSILTAVCMITAMLVFPMANKMYQKNRNKKKESKRQEKYKEYLTKLDNEIKEEITRQRRILIENNVDLKATGDIILYRKRNLWERKVNHKDFLELRLGIGSVSPKIKINYQKEHFTLEEDNLEQELREIINQNQIIEEVPVTHSFREKNITALIGKYEILRRYIDGLILQMITYHSYDELKIVILTNQKNQFFWEKFKNLPYCWNLDKTVRYYATNQDDVTKVSAELEQEYQNRNQTTDEQKKDIIYAPHYLIITDDVYMANKVGIVHHILKGSKANGFSLLYLTDKLNSLPSECSSFISVDPSIGGVFENELVNKKQEFKPDFTTTTIDSYVYAVSNIPIEVGGALFELPTVYSFLEMYDAGKVEQLNAFNRWQKNDPTTSLSCPVGIDENGELFKLDLHEKVHGPHGLIAGMTGSGKSEFIITYILSMAVNYDPKEVQFVLIDYKGGGLAGAFENKETGVKLPHLAGTITNLDVGEINRSLSSLQSELKRRQRMFNEARDACNESTIDIYKYQKLYREGKVKEPIAHLLIISDEFAELKSQQPEFMDELISTARIGRSLGVHLILATQKPSGVVDEQIWSNSKFRICLKVQDKSDSNDMIRSPQAAYLKETGRFYLQVGYNEYFAKGQSAWCGAPYYESEKRKKMIDNSMNFVDNTGGRIKSVDNDKQNLRGVHKGEEISNVLKYIQQIGENENIKVRQLWLDAIPAMIYVDKLKQKYNYQKKAFVINPVIGEYDAPKEQVQNILTVPLTEGGNLIIYGAVGSGKENLISTMIYSMMTTYTVEELNMYVLDFGSEALKIYSKAPQVGGVVGSEEKDKVTTLFRLLRQKIDERKKLFADYTGSYDNYCANSGNTVPTIVTFINGFESFNEMYPEFADELVLLTREGQKYGIIFVLTVSATNNIRMKLSQNFNEKLMLQMNEEFDYRQILGRTELVPSKIVGRGLVKRENIYEFQTAYPIDPAELTSYVSEVINRLNEMMPKKAQAIPTLPDVVTTSFVSSEFGGLIKVPIGVSKEDLNILSVDIKNHPSLLISSQRITHMQTFVKTLIYELSTIKNTSVYLIDAERLIDEVIPNVKSYTSGFDKVFDSFKKIIDKLNDIYVKSGYDSDSLNGYSDVVLVITGIGKLKTILGSEFDTLVGQTMMLSKKLTKVNYILVETFDNLKKLEYDLWYKDIVNSTRGIWIGNGLAEQNIFKLYVNTRAISNNIPDNFGYNIVSGMPQLFKYIESYNTDDEVL